jgi:FKBP-type peptidyl-prolyl cis-trans isomerase
MSDKVINYRLTACKKKITSCFLSLFAYRLSLVTLSLITYSCTAPAPQIPANKLEEHNISEDLMLLSKSFAAFENEEIEHYIDSLKLDMQQTSTGLRYKIINEGNGNFFQKKDTVTFTYSIRTLEGSECKELKNVTKTIELGKGETENGIEEAVMLLKASGKGQFIIPSHLAFGVSGYRNCIPAWTPVFCEINIIESELKR